MGNFSVQSICLEYTHISLDYICCSGLIAPLKSNNYGPAFQRKSNLIQ